MKIDNKAQTVERNDKTGISTQERPLDRHIQKSRVNINDINKRNAEQENKERKSLYAFVGITALLIVVIVISVYVFS